MIDPYSTVRLCIEGSTYERAVQLPASTRIEKLST